MQGYQFGHVETWSRKGVAKQNGKQMTVRCNGQRGWTADQIIDEAAREPEASEHVGRNKREPGIIAGTCASFDELRDAHELACSVKIATPYRCKKTGKKSVRKKSVRMDTHTLYTAVVSLPVYSAEALGDPKKMAECNKAFELAVAFEKRRLEDAGGEFAMAAIHLDESHVHLHIYGLDRQRGSVNGLHPGKAALDEFRARHGDLSRKGTTLYQQSQRAYCDAMRGWQDDIHEEVFGKFGLCRLGPRRFRYSRVQWRKRMREEEERAKAQETIRSASTMKRHLTAATEAVEAREEKVSEVSEALQVERYQLKEKREYLDAKEQKLDAGLATVEAMAEGFLEQYEEENGAQSVRPSLKAREHPLWPQLRRRLRRAPREVMRIGKKLTATLEEARKRAAAEGREDARRAAQKELSEKYARLGAVHAFARELIGRLRTPEEQNQATEELKTATMQSAADRARLNRPEKSGGKDDLPEEI